MRPATVLAFVAAALGVVYLATPAEAVDQWHKLEPPPPFYDTIGETELEVTANGLKLTYPQGGWFGVPTSQGWDWYEIDPGKAVFMFDDYWLVPVA